MNNEEFNELKRECIVAGISMFFLLVGEVVYKNTPWYMILKRRKMRKKLDASKKRIKHEFLNLK